MAIGTIGKYERLDVLGHGASGVVYLAWDTLLRRQVALKEIRAAAPEMERVLQEARVLDRLRHPNIVAVHSVDQENGAVLIDMELVRGQNLSDLLRERAGAPLPLAEAVRITLAVLDALAYAHGQRIVHRDVKPANILIGRDGSTVKLTDFGLAEALGSASLAGGGGTYPYMAPEDFAAEEASDYRSDLWAVGVMLYEMLTGRRPFAVVRPKDPFAWKRAVETEQPPRASALRPDLPSALDRVIERALAKDKAARYPSARAFAEVLGAAAGIAAAGRAHPEPSAVADAAASGTPPAGTAAVPSGPFRFERGATVAHTLDDLLLASARHWGEARRALLDGRFERWLRAIGEVYIADLAAELAAREGVDADMLLREFLDRSGLDIAEEQARRSGGGDDAATAAAADPWRGAVDAGETLLFRVPRLEADAPPRRERRRFPLGRRPESPPATPGPKARPDPVAADPARPAAAAAAALPRAAAPQQQMRWWFWPLLALCIGPPAAALWRHLPHNQQGRHNDALEAWAVSGFLSSLLFLVGLGAQVSTPQRIACLVPVAGGLLAAGALASALLSGRPSLDSLILASGLVVVLLFVLLVESVTTARGGWRPWAWIVFAAALAAIAHYGPFLIPFS